MARKMIRDNLVMENKARQIKYLLVKCDGVLTDGALYCFNNGDEFKRFSESDLIGADRLRNSTGIEIGLISESDSPIISHFADKLRASHLYMGLQEKEAVLDELLEKHDLHPEQVAFIGNEVDDVELMKMIGFSACPLDAAYEARGASDYVCNSCGGNGVLRELAEFLIVARLKDSCLVD